MANYGMKIADRDPKDFVLTAYHEAGHAVMALRHGYWTEHLTIERVDDALGVFRQQPERGAADQLSSDEHVRRLCLEQVDILLGGWVAEHRFDATSFWAHSKNDFRRLVFVAALRADSNAEMHQFIRDRIADVAACLKDERVWSCVERLADTLLANRTLSGKVLHKLMWDLRCRLDGQTYLGPTGVRSAKIDALASLKREAVRDYDIIYGMVAALCGILLVVNLLVLSQCSG